MRPAPSAVFALLPLVACGNKEQPAPVPTTPAAPTAAAAPRQPAEDPGETVVVTVVDWKGLPVRGATVRFVVRPDERVSPFRTTDAEGHATFSRTDVERQRTWRVEAPSDRVDLARFGVADSDARRIRIGPGFTLTITVKDDRDQPTQAKIWCRTDLPELWTGLGKTSWRVGESIVLTEVDAQGRVELRGLPRLPLELQATPPSAIAPANFVYSDWTTVNPETPSVVLTRQRIADVGPVPPIHR